MLDSVRISADKGLPSRTVSQPVLKRRVCGRLQRLLQRARVGCQSSLVHSGKTKSSNVGTSGRSHERANDFTSTYFLRNSASTWIAASSSPSSPSSSVQYCRCQSWSGQGHQTGDSVFRHWSLRSISCMRGILTSLALGSLGTLSDSWSNRASSRSFRLSCSLSSRQRGLRGLAQVGALAVCGLLVH